MLIKVTIAIIILTTVLIWSSIVILTQPISQETAPLLIDIKKTWFSDEWKLEEYTKTLSTMDRTSAEWRKEVVMYITNILKSINIDSCPFSGERKDFEWCYTLQEYSIVDEKHNNIIVGFQDPRKLNGKYIIWAHYDSHWWLPWADDNASGVAWILELIRVITASDAQSGSRVEFVLYSSEEPPYFGTENMWSYNHASMVDRNNVLGVIILEMIWYFSDEHGSQNFPVIGLNTLYPETGNFIALISNTNIDNIFLLRKLKKSMSTFLNLQKWLNIYSINAPSSIPGIDFSDHRNYWKKDIPALMITDTAFYRNKNYHTPFDTYEKLDYLKMKTVVDAVIFSLHEFSNFY